MSDTKTSRKVSFSVWSSSQIIRDTGKRDIRIIRKFRTNSEDGTTIYRGGVRLKENGDVYIKQLSTKEIAKKIKMVPKYVHWFRTYTDGHIEDVFPTRNEERRTLDGVFHDI